MEEHEDRKQRVQASVMRLLMLAAVAGGFITMASFLTPEQTAAMPAINKGLQLLRPSAPAKVPANAARPPSRSRSGGMLLGEMVGAENRVWVYGQGAEVRYTVCTLHGDVLMAEMEADEVYRLFPELDLRSMRLEPTPEVSDAPSGPLMIADTKDDGR